MMEAMEVTDDRDLDEGLLHQCEQLEWELTERDMTADEAVVTTALEGDVVALEELGTSTVTSVNTSAEVAPVEL